MSQRIVYARVGRRPQVVPLDLSMDADWVHVRALHMAYADACRVLSHLHLQYHFLDVPHRLSCNRDADGLEFIDAVSVPRSVAEEYLFPKLVGLADAADDKQGTH